MSYIAIFLLSGYVGFLVSKASNISTGVNAKFFIYLGIWAVLWIFYLWADDQ